MEGSTYSKVLDVAQTMVMRNGFNAFSYRDLSDAIGIKTSSIHYYFPSKDDLGVALVNRYNNAIKDDLEEIEAATDDAEERLRRYFALFEATLPEELNQVCLCGMMASDYYTLSDKIQLEVRELFMTNESWLTKTLEQGRKIGQFNFADEPQNLARLMFSSLQGSILAERMFASERRVSQMSKIWLTTLS